MFMVFLNTQYSASENTVEENMNKTYRRVIPRVCSLSYYVIFDVGICVERLPISGCYEVMDLFSHDSSGEKRGECTTAIKNIVDVTPFILVQCTYTCVSIYNSNISIPRRRRTIVVPFVIGPRAPVVFGGTIGSQLIYVVTVENSSHSSKLSSPEESPPMAI